MHIRKVGELDMGFKGTGSELKQAWWVTHIGTRVFGSISSVVGSDVGSVAIVEVQNFLIVKVAC